MRPNLEFPEDLTEWVNVVFGNLTVLADDAQAAIREAGADFFVKAADIYARTGADLKALTRELGQLTGRKGPGLYMPLRAALTGATHGPELAPLLGLMSAESVRARFIAASALCS